MELKTAQHLAVLTNRFKGTGGIMNRHFVETLDSLYGPGLVCRNLRHIVSAVRTSTPYDHCIGPDSILAVSFLQQHQVRDFQWLRDNICYTGPERSRRAICVRVPIEGHHLGVLLLSNGGEDAMPTFQLPSHHLQTEQDWAWAHDQILEKGADFLYGSGWSSTQPPSRRTTIAVPG